MITIPLTHAAAVERKQMLERILHDAEAIAITTADLPDGVPNLLADMLAARIKAGIRACNKVLSIPENQIQHEQN